jgi:hypothetical protein
MPARRKYRARNPRMANAFEVKTRNGSSVTAKIAGIESTANTTSVLSMATRTASIGVATHLPPWRTKNRWPWYASTIGIRRRSRRSTGLRAGSTEWPDDRSIFTPVSSRRPPKT